MTKCFNLNDKINVCEIYPCIDLVTGQKTNSASPTDIWFLSFKDNTHYENVNIKNAFIKLFISPNSLILYDFNDKYKKNIKGLQYELLVYKNVIKPLIDNNISPNFIRYLGSGIECNENDLFKILSGNMMLDEDEIKENLRRNLLYIISGKSDRPAINFFSKKSFDTIYNDKVTYNMIMAEMISPRTVSLSNLLDTKQMKNHPEFWNILFQCILACYSMSLAKMVHNDLHAGNIWVEHMKEEVVITYLINDTCYSFKTKYKIMLYDFDRSYVINLNNNPSLLPNDKGKCFKNNQCNQFIPNKDMVKVIFYFYIYSGINNTEKNKLLNLLTCKNKVKKELINILGITKDARFLRYKGEPIKENTFNKLDNAEQILTNVSKRISLIKNNFINPYDKYTYVCNKKTFNDNGTLNLKELENIKQSWNIKTFCLYPSNKTIYNNFNNYNKKRIYTIYNYILNNPDLKKNNYYIDSISPYFEKYNNKKKKKKRIIYKGKYQF